MARGGYTHGKRRLGKPAMSDDNTLASLSAEERHALRWFREREPVGYLDVSDDLKVYPQEWMRSHLKQLGLIEECPARGMELIKYRTTETGRAALLDTSSAVTVGK